jgi:hypothetical protein
MKIVKKIPSDMTYRQHELSSIVRGYWIKSNKPELAPTSTDLKSATDRIPVEVSAKVLSKI